MESPERRGVTVAIDCSRAPTEILVQESRFQQMLVNLVKNAMEVSRNVWRAWGTRAGVGGRGSAWWPYRTNGAS